MAYSSYSSGNSGEDLSALSYEERQRISELKRNTSKLVADADRAAEEYERTHQGEEEREEKFLGIIPMPGYMVAQAEMIWGGLLGMVLPSAQEHSYNFITKKDGLFSKSLGMVGIKNANPKTIQTAALSVGVASMVLPLAWQPISAMMNGYKDERKKLVDAAKYIAPVLDDITGKHSLSSLMTIKAEQNEMIYAYRKHKQAAAQLTHTNNFISMLSVTPSVVLAGVNARNLRNNNTANASIAAAGGAAADAHQSSIAAKIAGWSAGSSAAVIPILDLFKKANERRFKRKARSVTATDMVIELERQISASGSDLRDYALPKGSGRSSANLTDYVVEIIKAHQLDMAALDAEYVPLRKAFDEQLREVAKPIAEAIKNGEISTLALIRLIGEGHVVRNHGRALAKPSDIQKRLQEIGVNTASYMRLDPKEYFADAAFNKKEVKEALDALKGDERLFFAAMFPDSVLAEVGVGEKEIKDIRDATLGRYKDQLSKLVTGMAAEDDKALQDMGLAKEEIKQIRDAADQIRSGGAEALQKLSHNPTNPVGIERVLATAALDRIHVGEAGYLGKVMSKGSPAKVAATETPVDDAAKPLNGGAKTASHAEKEASRRDASGESQEKAI
ncbi:MAG: hypothetical protein J0M34_00865 [Alphaproteobacteria bacterium]|nr:hypothetical protein [Alphaproteobacteria bacterium]